MTDFYCDSYHLLLVLVVTLPLLFFFIDPQIERERGSWLLCPFDFAFPIWCDRRVTGNIVRLFSGTVFQYRISSHIFVCIKQRFKIDTEWGPIYRYSSVVQYTFLTVEVWINRISRIIKWRAFKKINKWWYIFLIRSQPSNQNEIWNQRTTTK